MSFARVSRLAGPLGVVFLLGACGAEVPPAAPQAPAPAGSVAPAASSAPPEAKAPEPPPPPPCSEVVKRLAFGKTLDRRSDELKGLPQGGSGALTELFPAVKAEGYEVEQVVAIQLGDDESARALILHKPRGDEDGPTSLPDTWLGFVSCSAERGYVMEKSPPSLGDNSATVVWGVERERLPGGSTATLLTLALGGSAWNFTRWPTCWGWAPSVCRCASPGGAGWGCWGFLATCPSSS